jgi:hypothetical protein
MTNTVLQAIETRHLGPTNSHGAKVKATAAAGSLTLTWDHSLDREANHRAAAEALALKYGWKGTLAQGVLASGANVFVFTTRED